MLHGEQEMEANVGKTDKMIRIAAGVLLLSLAFVGPKTPWGFIGVVPLVTAFINFCPAYKLLGVNTCGK
ncbi:YgaP-like transmembrane domain [Methylocystis parvus]